MVSTYSAGVETRSTLPVARPTAGTFCVRRFGGRTAADAARGDFTGHREAVHRSCAALCAKSALAFFSLIQISRSVPAENCPRPFVESIRTCRQSSELLQTLLRYYGWNIYVCPVSCTNYTLIQVFGTNVYALDYAQKESVRCGRILLRRRGRAVPPSLCDGLVTAL